MLITRETDYALRLLRSLRGGERLTSGELAAREMVPQAFAYKILKKLAKVGLVQTTRGADGGCKLAGDLTQVTLYDLMAAMEEDRTLIACMDPIYQCAWSAQNGGCGVHCHLAAIQRKLDDELRSHTLAEILCPMDS